MKNLSVVKLIEYSQQSRIMRGLSTAYSSYLSATSRYRKYFFPILLLIIFVPLVVLRLHGSSLNLYNRWFYGDNYDDPNLVFGNSRGIRTDEWLVQTSWSLSESQIYYDDDNSLYLGDQNFTLSDIPVRNWTMMFKPQYWSSLILPVEYAFSFKWWFRAILLLLSSYVFFLHLTRGRIAASVLASLAFFLSPFFQWWYSTTFIELTSYSFLIILLFFRMINYQKPIHLLLYTILFTYVCLCFLLLLYPPSQISLALFYVFFALGMVLNMREKFDARRIKGILLALFASMAFIAGILVLFYFSFQETIDLVRNTVYPGAMSYSGGSMPVIQLFGGVYNIQLLDDYKLVPPFLQNQSEASSFFMFSIFLVPVFLHGLVKGLIRKEKLDFALIFILLFYFLALAWSFWGLPEFVAKLLFFNHIAPKRLMNVFGVINILLILYFLFRFQVAKNTDYKIFAVLYSVGVFVFFALMGRYLKVNFPSFIQSDLKIIFIAGTSALLILLMLLQRRLLFLLILFAFTFVSAYRVNPIYSGLSPILDSELSDAIDRIEQNDPDQSLWAVYDHLYLENYVQANGGSAINGTRYHPNFDFWQKLDPDKEFVDSYNRYNHSFLRLTDDDDIIEIELRSADVVVIEVNPCNEVLDEMNVDYFLLSKPVDYQCLQLFDTVAYPKLSFYIYTRVPDSSTPAVSSDSKTN